MAFGALLAVSAAGALQAEAGDVPVLTAAEVRKLVLSLSNDGRWGRDDELGTLNLITPAVRRRAASLVREGDPVSLSLDTNATPGPNNQSPFGQELSFRTVGGLDYAFDRYVIEEHGWGMSHLDGLSHISDGGKSYNGVPRAAVVSSEQAKAQGGKVGATKLGIGLMADGVMSRGVLVDIPRLKGLPYLEPGTPITVRDLEEWEKASGVRVGSGDVLLVRTGRWARVRARGEWDGYKLGFAGLHASAVQWLKARGVSVLGSDGFNDVYPSRVEGIGFPVHLLALKGLGMPLMDNLDLEGVAIKAEKYKRFTFLFTVAPLRIPGGSGSPINATAVF